MSAVDSRDHLCDEHVWVRRWHLTALHEVATCDEHVTHYRWLAFAAKEAAKCEEHVMHRRWYLREQAETQACIAQALRAEAVERGDINSGW